MLIDIYFYLFFLVIMVLFVFWIYLFILLGLRVIACFVWIGRLDFEFFLSIL